VDGVTSSIQTQLNAKQATLVSATNIKTINGTSLLGSGDLVVSGSGTVDDATTAVKGIVQLAQTSSSRTNDTLAMTPLTTTALAQAIVGETLWNVVKITSGSLTGGVFTVSYPTHNNTNFVCEVDCDIQWPVLNAGQGNTVHTDGFTVEALFTSSPTVKRDGNFTGNFLKKTCVVYGQETGVVRITGETATS
jgi:hypothetical protein